MSRQAEQVREALRREYMRGREDEAELRAGAGFGVVVLLALAAAAGWALGHWVL